jgi:phosphoglycerate dehydrogenase-like enzyme
MKDILVWATHDDAALCAALRQVPGARVHTVKNASEAQALMAHVDGMIMSVVRWDANFAQALADAPRLVWVQILNAGFDNMERLGVPERVVVSTIGDIASAVVAEHALALLLALVRRVPQALSAQHRAEWAHRGIAPTETLGGMNVAVLGHGHIGQRVVSLLGAFGARPLVVASTERLASNGIRVRPLDALPAVLREASALVICVPLNDTTRKVMNQSAFGAMRRGSYLVNIARGGIVDTQAMVAALESGVLAGAALDVTDPEPLPPSHPLWRHPNVLLTPHVASSGTTEAEQLRLREFLVEQVSRFVNGEEVLYRAHMKRH